MNNYTVRLINLLDRVDDVESGEDLILDNTYGIIVHDSKKQKRYQNRVGCNKFVTDYSTVVGKTK